MKKSSSLAITLSSALFTVAVAALGFVPDASARPAMTSVGRGAVKVTGRAVKAVTVGPATLHTYSEFAGGAIFVARAAGGTDADCAAALAAPAGAHPTTLVADQVSQVQLDAGQVACLVTDTNRPFELLWHAFTVGDATTAIASAK